MSHKNIPVEKQVLAASTRQYGTKIAALLKTRGLPDRFYGTPDVVNFRIPQTNNFFNFVKRAILPYALEAVSAPTEPDADTNFVIHAFYGGGLDVGLSDPAWGVQITDGPVRSSHGHRPIDSIGFYYPDISEARKALRDSGLTPRWRATDYPCVRVDAPDGLAFQIAGIPSDSIRNRAIDLGGRKIDLSIKPDRRPIQ